MVTAECGRRGDNEEDREALPGQRGTPTAGQRLDPLEDAPIDVGMLRSDEWLLDALGSTNPQPPTLGQDALLASLLLAWRREVDATPIGELIDLDTAAAAIAHARRPRRLYKHLIPLASAAAVLTITFAGVGLAARDAQPGQLLWGMEQMLYPARAHAAEAASQARVDLATANAAFLHGDRSAAEVALQRAQQQMRNIDAEHGLPDLQATQASLAAKINHDRSTTTAPPAAVPAVPTPRSPAVPPSTPPAPSSASTTPTSPPSATSSPSPTSSPAETTSTTTSTPAT